MALYSFGFPISRFHYVFRAESRFFYVALEIFVVHYFLARFLNLCLSWFAVCRNYLLVFLATFLSFPKKSAFDFTSGLHWIVESWLTELRSFRIRFWFGSRLWETRIGSGFIVCNILYLSWYSDALLRPIYQISMPSIATPTHWEFNVSITQKQCVGVAIEGMVIWYMGLITVVITNELLN